MSERLRWTEKDTQEFLAVGDILVPYRHQQIQMLIDLIPAQRDEAIEVLELGAGAGLLAEAVLEAFPASRVTALDGSEAMRALMVHRLGKYGDRIRIQPFDLASQEWREAIPRKSLRAVLSSLCVHHVDAAGKRQLFYDMNQRLEPGGAFLLADIVYPPTPQVARLYADRFDEIVKRQSLEMRGNLDAYEQALVDRWNYYRYDYITGEGYDTPSPLHDQLRWFLERGYAWSDAFWLEAGFAIYGGFKA